MDDLDDLLQAIANGETAGVRRIIAARPDLLKATDGAGFTPLMRATSCSERTVEVTRELLDAGAEVNRQTAEGYTALHWAIDVARADRDSREVIALLAERGADLALRQVYGWTPLLAAVVQGTPAQVEALLSAGADPNDRLPLETLPAFNAGRTALMAALASCFSVAIVAALLRAGADPRGRDAGGGTFFDYAAHLLRESPNWDFAAAVKRCLEIARKQDGRSLV